MIPLTAREALDPQVVRVMATIRPQDVAERGRWAGMYAVFDEEEGVYLGLVTEQACARFPRRIFADLLPEPPPAPVAADTPIEVVSHRMGTEGEKALPVLDEKGVFLGVITRPSLLESLLRRERELLAEAGRLQERLEAEQQRLLAWSKRLEELNEASRTLLGLVGQTAVERAFLQEGLRALATLLQAHYGAIGLLGEAGGLQQFISTGLTPDEADRFEELLRGPGLLGLRIRENQVLRLQDLTQDPRHAGFPPNHPLMKGFLAVPISHQGQVYGQVYLCDKTTGEPFTEEDERLTVSFARSLALALAHARELAERKLAEEALETRAREEQVLRRLSQTLLGLLNPKAIAQVTFEAIRERLQLDAVGLRVPDAKGTHLEMIAAEGWMKDQIDHLRVPLEPPELSGAAWAVHTRTPILGDHTRPHQPFVGHEAARRAGVKACLHVPMLIQQRVVGVLTINRLTADAYTDDDVRFLTLIANLVGIALDRAREHQAVREAEAGYRTLFDGVPVGLYRTTPGGEILDANPALVHMLGYPDRDALLAVNAAGLYVDPEQFTQWQALADRQGTVRNLVTQVRRRDGSIIWVEVNARSVRGADGGDRYYEGSLEDITERKQAEEALLAHTFQIEAVRAVGMEITRELDLDALLGLIGQRAAGLVAAESGGVYLWDEAAQVLALQARYSAGEDVGEVRLRLGEGVAGTVAQRREGLIVNEYRTSPHALPLFVERGITAVLAEPLLYHERLVGVIAVGSKGSGRAFTEQEREILSLFATEAAIAIENARLHEATVQRARQLAMLNEVSRTLTTLLDPQRVAQEILAAVQVLIPGAAGRLWERVGETDVLRLVAAVGLREPEGGDTLRLSPQEGLAGIAAATRQPVISPDVTSDPRFANRAWAAAEGLVSCIVLPLISGERVQGVLLIFTHAPHAFTDEEVGLLRTFAAQAAIALENARLFEQVRAGRKRLQLLSRKLVEVQEVERRHIARELHDEIGQVLTGLKLTLEMSSRLPADAARTSLIEAQTLVNDLIAQVRELSLDLRPAILDDLGLLPALLVHFERYTAKTRVRVTLEHAGLGRRFPSEVETAAYRIVQEALTNIARHAGVGEASVGLWADEERLDVQIEDGGAGFDPDAVLSAVTSSGLVGMRERAVLVGGHLSVESAPGAGTRLMAELPLGRRFEKRKKER